MVLIVCGLDRLDAVVAARRPSHLLTLIDPRIEVPTPRSMAPERHLRIAVDDVSAALPGYICPDEAMVARLLEFGRGWDGGAPMVIHCMAGISRSTATAFALACDRSPGADERAIAMAMRQAAPHALPNRRITALADRLLGRDGRMIAGVEAMGGNGFVPSGVPFDFAARHS